MHTSVSNLLYSHTLDTVSLANKLQDRQNGILCNFSKMQVCCGCFFIFFFIQSKIPLHRLLPHCSKVRSLLRTCKL